MFTLTINTHNAAFEDNALAELAKMLHKVALKLDAGRAKGIVMDANGNKVGDFAYREDN